MFEVSLQDEVDRKALSSLEQLIDNVDSGVITPEDGRKTLGIIQTAFNGIVSDRDFLHLITEADEHFTSLPKLTISKTLAYFKDKKSTPAYIIRYNNETMIISSKGRVINKKPYETPYECYSAVLKAHNLFIKKGLINLCN